MKGSLLFNKDINIEVDVDPAADEGAKLTSAVNLVDGQALGGSGGRCANLVNITWANLPQTFSNFDRISLWLSIRNDEFEDGYAQPDSETLSSLIAWDDEWATSNMAMAYNSKAENGEYCFAAPQNYLPSHKIVVVSGDADDSNPAWLEIFGDCTLTIEAVE